MSWTLFFQLVMLALLLGLLVNTIVNNVVSHYWQEQGKFYDGHTNLIHGEDEKPKPYTTYEGV